MDGVTFTHRFVEAPGDYEDTQFGITWKPAAVSPPFFCTIPDSWFQVGASDVGAFRELSVHCRRPEGVWAVIEWAGDYRHEGASEQLYAMLQKIGVTNSIW